MLQNKEKCPVVFHFNKAHLSNSEIPPWVIKLKGNTHYVNHVTFIGIDFCTKETPDNPHTKGAIKCVGYVYIDDNQEALITGELL